MVVRSQRYLEAYEHIAGLIAGLQPGDRLPSEELLGKQLGMSRNTVRDALMKLEREGVILRRHGVGTFVAPRLKHLHTRLNEITPIPDLITASGYRSSVQDLSVLTTPGPAAAAQALQVAAGEALPTVSLVYLADERPAVFITYYLCPAMRPALKGWKGHAAFDGRMVHLVEQALGIPVHQSHARIAAVAASKAVAQRLKVAPGSPLLMFTTVGYSQAGQPLYYSVSYQDSNLLEVQVVRHRR